VSTKNPWCLAAAFGGQLGLCVKIFRKNNSLRNRQNNHFFHWLKKRNRQNNHFFHWLKKQGKLPVYF
jgi:hypothetical protein